VDETRSAPVEKQMCKSEEDSNYEAKRHTMNEVIDAKAKTKKRISFHIILWFDVKACARY
jgi:hypothetical protein